MSIPPPRPTSQHNQNIAAATARRRRHIYVALIASVAAISGLLFGFDTAVINGGIVMLQRQFHLGSFETEVAATSLLVGCLIGAVGAGWLSDRLGRHKLLIASGALFAISAIGVAFSQELAGFSAGRLVGGLAIGLASTLAPVYIAEIAPEQTRGMLVSLNQLAIVVGILLAYLSNWGLATLGESSWRWMFASGAVPAAFFLFGLAFIPESPRWLFLRGRHTEARAILERIAGAEQAQREMDQIRAASLEEPARIRDLFAPGMSRRLLVAIALAVFQQISGINTVLYYGSVLLNNHLKGESTTAAIGANVVVGVVNLVGTIVAMFLIDRWGRRSLLLLSSGGMAACLAALSIALKIPGLPIAMAFASVLCYVAFFAIGLGPTVWVYIAELFPNQLRGRATSIAVSALWAACIAVTLTFLTIVDALGVSSAFLVYAGLSLATFIFVWTMVPETRGKTLEELQTTWSRK